jgi:hypothetical protein
VERGGRNNGTPRTPGRNREMNRAAMFGTATSENSSPKNAMLVGDEWQDGRHCFRPEAFALIDAEPEIEEVVPLLMAS